MGTPRRRFSREPKLEAVSRVQETSRTQAQVAEELGVSSNTAQGCTRNCKKEASPAAVSTLPI